MGCIPVLDICCAMQGGCTHAAKDAHHEAMLWSGDDARRFVDRKEVVIFIYDLAVTGRESAQP